MDYHIKRTAVSQEAGALFVAILSRKSELRGDRRVDIRCLNAHARRMAENPLPLGHSCALCFQPDLYGRERGKAEASFRTPKRTGILPIGRSFRKTTRMKA